MKQIAIIVHGGAGAWQPDSQRLQDSMTACRAAARVGQDVLLAGGSALDAVETAVRLLEDAPSLDAGRGSYPNTEGEVELDALIMDGRSLDVGAVAAVKQVRNPISLARRVMADSPHAMLAGPGAERFADRIGFPRCEMADLIVTESEEGLNVVETGPTGDTVGAAAIDQDGNLAAATSTGGTRNKWPGRVGDSPLVGSGGYADNLTAAVSATGHGESLMTVVISKTTCDFVAQGLPAKAACRAAIALLEARVQGSGGLIAVDHNGRIGFAFNTTAMPYAYAAGEGAVEYGR